MPSPVGHTLMGYIVYIASNKATDNKQWKYIAFVLLAANAPDLDFIPGLLIGDPGKFHHGISHSIGFSFCLAVCFSVLLYFLKREKNGRNFAICFFICFSHIFLDYLTIDTSPPYGAPLFWPLSYTYYHAPFPILPDIQRVSTSNTDFITSLVSLHNLWAVSVEILILLPILLLLFAWKRKKLCTNI